MGLAQLVSFSIFFWSMIALARQVSRRWSLPTAVAVSGLAAFTPIVAHVHTHYWLDGPQLAFATAGAAMYLYALKRRNRGWIFAAGFLLAWACLTKLNAVFVLPAIFALGWAVDPGRSFRRLLAPMAIVAGIVAITLLPWMWAQWRAFGEIFPSWAGKPAADLVATNPFVRFVTVARGPWSYFRLLPQAATTLLPSLIALLWLWKDKRSHRIEIVLCAWIFGILLIHVALGYVGYSKLLRYVILVVPATILLFAPAVEGALERIREQKRGAIVFLALASAAFVTEVALGVAYIEIYFLQALIALYPDMRMFESMMRSMR
jgi:4-amino-4-deoxy-L-arabinose transferase-like glycosyltransferase